MPGKSTMVTSEYLSGTACPLSCARRKRRGRPRWVCWPWWWCSIAPVFFSTVTPGQLPTCWLLPVSWLKRVVLPLF